MNTKFADQAKKTIGEVYFLNIASVTTTGKAWNTPVYFSFDKKYNFYWYSPMNAQHSENIRFKPQVFITVYQTAETGVGVYIEAKARELENQKEIEEAMSVFDRKYYSLPNKNVEDFLGDSPVRFYKATPIKTWVSSPETASKFNELWVDKRVEIKLS